MKSKIFFLDLCIYLLMRYLFKIQHLLNFVHWTPFQMDLTDGNLSHEAYILVAESENKPIYTLIYQVKNVKVSEM